MDLRYTCECLCKNKVMKVIFFVKRNTSSYYYSLSVVFECVYIMLDPYSNNIDLIIFFYLFPQVSS
jgi:hypothetical protein